MKDVIIIGAGIAGASVAYACARRGLSVQLLEKGAQIATEASGNPAGILYPYMAQQWDAATSFYLQGFAYTHQLLRALDAAQAWHGLVGMLHVPKARDDAKELARLQGLADALGLSESVMQRHRQGFFMPASGWVKMPAFCAALVQQRGVEYALGITITSRVWQENHWQLMDDMGRVWQARKMVLANAYAASQLLPFALPLRRIRGQISYVPAHVMQESPSHVLCYGGYCTPAIEGVHYVGATFDKDRADLQVDAASHRQNIALLQAHFPEMVPSSFSEPLWHSLQGRAGFRTVSADRMPIIGTVHDEESLHKQLSAMPYSKKTAETLSIALMPNLYLSVAHGARGLVSAPLAGEMIAQQMAGSEIDIVPKAVQQLLCSERFTVRTWRKKELIS